MPLMQRAFWRIDFRCDWRFVLTKTERLIGQKDREIFFKPLDEAAAVSARTPTIS
jgi:hypothetical protein